MKISQVGLLVKVGKGFGSQKSGLGSRPQSTKNCELYQLIAELFLCRVPLLGSWIMAGGQV